MALPTIGHDLGNSHNWGQLLQSIPLQGFSFSLQICSGFPNLKLTLPATVPTFHFIPLFNYQTTIHFLQHLDLLKSPGPHSEYPGPHSEYPIWDGWASVGRSQPPSYLPHPMASCYLFPSLISIPRSPSITKWWGLWGLDKKYGCHQAVNQQQTNEYSWTRNDMVQSVLSGCPSAV